MADDANERSEERKEGSDVDAELELEEEADRDWAELRRPEGWFLETGKLSDVTVLCGGRSYALHKMVLCRESEYFHQTLLVPDGDQEITLDFEEEDFEGFCAMLYNTGVVGKLYEQAVMDTMVAAGISSERALKICSIADELGCPQVVLNVRYFFDQTLEPPTAILFLKGSWELPHLKYFCTRSLEVMVRSFETYLGDDNIGRAPPASPRAPPRAPLLPAA